MNQPSSPPGTISNRTKLLIGGIILAILAAGGYYLYRGTLEKHTVQVPKIFFGGSRNPYSMASELLSRMDLDVQTLAQSTAIPDPSKDLPLRDTLFVFASTRAWPQARVQGLLDWAQNGGHLVFQIVDSFEDSNANEALVLDYFGIETYSDRYDYEDGSPLIYQPGIDELEIDFDTEQYLYDYDGAAQTFIGDSEVAHMLQYRHGSGLVTLLADSGPFTNDYLPTHDHARIWHQLATQHGNAGAWIVFRTEAAAWYQLLWEYASMAVIALAVLVLLSLWYLGFRFGPRHQPNTSSRREITEHLAAAAQWNWQHQPQVLLNAAQQRVEQQARRRHPQWSQLDDEARHAWLAEHSEADATQIRAALSHDSSQANSGKLDRKTFLTYIKTLNRTLR